MLVGQQRNGKILFVAKLAVALKTVFGNAKDPRACRFKVAHIRGKALGFRRTAWGVVARIEKQNKSLALQSSKTHCLARIAWEAEVWGRKLRILGNLGFNSTVSWGFILSQAHARNVKARVHCISVTPQAAKPMR